MDSCDRMGGQCAFAILCQRRAGVWWVNSVQLSDGRTRHRHLLPKCCFFICITCSTKIVQRDRCWFASLCIGVGT